MLIKSSAATAGELDRMKMGCMLVAGGRGRGRRINGQNRSRPVGRTSVPVSSQCSCAQAHNIIKCTAADRKRVHSFAVVV